MCAHENFRRGLVNFKFTKAQYCFGNENNYCKTTNLAFIHKMNE